MKTRLALLLAMACALLASCNSDKVKIVVSRDEDNLLNKSKLMVIDDKDTIRMQDTTFDIYITTGIHHLKFDTGEPVKIVVQKEGGMLNVDNQEFVAFEVSYEDIPNGHNDKGLDISKARIYPTVAIIIDSMIITLATESHYVPYLDRQMLLDSLLASKNGNLMALDKIIPGYDESEAISKFKKFGKNKMYIHKFWDYHVNEDMPDTISIKKRKSDFAFSSTTSRTTVLPASTFLLLAMMAPDEYLVRSYQEFVENKKPEAEDDEEAISDEEQHGD